MHLLQRNVAAQQTHKLRLHEIHRRYTRSTKTTSRLEFVQSNHKGARPRQKWPKLSSFNTQFKRKKHSHPGSISTLNLSQDRETKEFIFENFSEVETFRSIVAYFSAFTQVHCPHDRAPIHARSLFERGTWRGCLCRSRAATYCVTNDTVEHVQGCGKSVMWLTEADVEYGSLQVYMLRLNQDQNAWLHFGDRASPVTHQVNPSITLTKKEKSTRKDSCSILVHNARSTQILAEPSKKMVFRHLVGERKSKQIIHPAQFDWQRQRGTRSGQRLALICAQGRVVRQEARTRYGAEVDGIESEADRFNQYQVERHHRVEYSGSSAKSCRMTPRRMFVAPEKQPL